MPAARGYVRVSTDDQAQNGVSIEAQQQILNAYAVVKGFDDFAIYTDGGYSGKNMHRPGLQQLIADCRARKISAVVVWRLDRLSRSLRDVLELVEDDFTANGVTLISVTESIDTSTTSGRLMLNLLASFAQSERETDAERVRMAKDKMAKDCKHLGGYIPLGYRVDENGYYQIDEATAPIVRKIFKMYNARMGYAAILRYVKAAGIKSPRGGDLTKTSLNYILRNEKYIGTYIHNRTEPQSTRGKRSSRARPVEQQIRIPGGMPAIIDQATWDRACIIRAENQHCGGRHKPRVEFLLSGLCYCAVCGKRMVVDVGGKDRNGTTQRYYVCKNKCVPAARKEELENAVFTMLHAVATSSQALTQACDLANRFALGEAEDRQSEVRALEAQLIAARKRQHAITDFIAASGAQAPQTLLNELQALERAIHTLESRISKAQRPAVIYSAPLLLRVINAILRAQQKPPEQVKPLLQAALTGIHVGPADYRVCFHGMEDVEMRNSCVYASAPRGIGSKARTRKQACVTSVICGAMTETYHISEKCDNSNTTK